MNVTKSIAIFAGLGVLLGTASVFGHDLTSESLLLQGSAKAVPWRMSSNRYGHCCLGTSIHLFEKATRAGRCIFFFMLPILKISFLRRWWKEQGGPGESDDGRYHALNFIPHIRYVTSVKKSHMINHSV